MKESASTSEAKTKKQFKFKKRDLIFVVVGVLVAFVARFSLVDAQTVHHHANFALYVNGERDTFENFTFYEEISSCSGTDHDNPKTRVHMHKPSNDIVHVHDSGSTWGHLFANFGYALDNDILVTDNGIFEDGKDGKKLRFILNGKEVQSIANAPIYSEDRLLIDYGSTSDSELDSRYETVPNTAPEYNLKPDPSSCSGGTKETLKDRFIRTLGIESGTHSASQGH